MSGAADRTVAVFLDGGPAALSLPARCFHTVPGEIIRVMVADHHCYFRRTDQLVYFAGDRCVKFVWTRSEPAHGGAAP
ncbi:MAG: hypothetical protein JO100_04155 [Pseudonocardia sp.]|nr:hypothetical protein [Pseudonocardia sp.]